MDGHFQWLTTCDELKIQFAPPLGSSSMKGLVCEADQERQGDVLGNRKDEVIVDVRNPVLENDGLKENDWSTEKTEHPTEKRPSGNNSLCALPIRVPLIRKISANKITEKTEGPCCRICFRSSSEGRLLAPCACKGTMGSVHRNCLETWLTSRGIEVCELCGFQFVTCRTPQTFWDWWRNPENREDRRNILGDFLCFILLTPIGLTSLWLCIQGANHYRRYYGSSWETAALAALSVFLVLGYTLWIFISVRYHCAVFRRWRERHYNIHLIIADSPEVTTDNGHRNEPVMTSEDAAANSSESICLEGTDDICDESRSSSYRLINIPGRSQKL